MTAMIGALGHVTTTIILSLVISTMGNTLISEDLYNTACLVILLSLAGYYMFTYFYQGRRDAAACCATTSCEEGTALGTTSSTLLTDSATSKQTDDDDDDDTSNASNFAALSVVSLTTFSPCLGSMPMTLSLLSPPVQAVTVVKVWMTLAVTATCVMTSLVVAAFVGVRYAVLSKVKRHERLLLGVTLIVLAMVTYSMNSHEHHHHHHQGHEHGEEGVRQSVGTINDGGQTSSSCSHGHHHHHWHDHAHDKEETETQVLRKADVVKADINVVINGQRRKLAAKNDDDDDDKMYDGHDEG